MTRGATGASSRIPLGCPVRVTRLLPRPTPRRAPCQVLRSQPEPDRNPHSGHLPLPFGSQFTGALFEASLSLPCHPCRLGLAPCDPSPSHPGPSEAVWVTTVSLT